MADKDIFTCAYPEWQEMRESTTFWADFSIADSFGIAAVRDTFRRAFSEWKTNVKYMTELTMVMNHKLWYWHERDADYAKVYHGFWEKCDEWCMSHYTSDERKFYLGVTD